ncbi:MAG: hypothetical protein ACK6A7_06670 [Planctomycetota bacterium]
MRYFKIRWLELVLGIGCLLVVVSSTGRACPACLGPGVPKLTLVQRLADCDQIIVAKATLQQPEYVTIETVIRGELRAGSILEIPRGELPPLGFEESDRFLLGRQTLGRRWKRLATIDVGCETWLRQMAGLKRTSELTEQDWIERVGMFLPDLEHSNELIRDTAFGEIARAPFAAMRANRDRIDRERLLDAWRSTHTPAERRPLYVLLLGIRGGDEFDDCIDEQLSLLHRNHETQGLAAWWVAKLERTGPAGLEELQQRYLADSQRSEEERLAVCLALSVQGSGNRERFREPVVAIYRELIETGTVNTVIVTDLTLWSRLEFEPLMRRMLERSDLANPLREAIHSYLLASSK